jgi:uncharacterized membrane protein
MQAQTKVMGTCTFYDKATVASTESACKAMDGTWTGPYVLLAPLPGIGTTFDPGTKVGDNTALGVYLNAMIKIFIGLCAVLSVVMIVMGGIEYMTSELISNKEEGKKRIRDAIFGLLLALGAWTILNQINPDLLKSDINMPVATVTVNINDSVPQTPINGYYGMFKDGENWTELGGNTEPLPEYVSVYNSLCTTIGQKNCTSIQSLKMDTVKAVQWGCKCSIQISGGTEFWLHGGATGNTSHKPGSSTVDLLPTTQLDTYLSGGKPLVNMTRYPPTNALYEITKEGPHWHIGP